MIKKKFLAILLQKGIPEVAKDDDMAGTIVVCVMFGLLLALKGKIQFGNIYGFGLTGCCMICLLINLLLRNSGVYLELYSTISVMGYSLLPFVFLAGASIFFDLMNVVGVFFAGFIVLWSCVTATRLFEHSLTMRDQKYLIAYPIGLFYCVFVMLTIF